MRRQLDLARTLQTVTLVAVLPFVASCDRGSPDATGGPATMRRLTAEQYRHAIEDTFGAKVEVAGRFEPDSRRDGLNALGTSLVSVSPSGLEQYEAIARDIAAQVTSDKLRGDILPCEPSQIDAHDDRCTEQVLQQVGPGLLRRPLTDKDIAPRLAAAAQTANTESDFYAGLRLALLSLLASPEFLFRLEVTEPAPLPEQPNRLRLSDTSLAGRLSYFLWNRGPDEALLAAAQRGELSDPLVLQREVDRMLASPRLAGGVRAFFEDVFSFDLFDELNKDVARYPLYSNQVAMDAREQTLRFVVQQLLDRQADYRTLFTSRDIPMTRSLGPLYGVPVRVVDGWEDAALPAGQPRAGLLSHVSFAMLHAHPGRSSPTLRGVFMREALLCQTVPEAPADVDFTQFVQDVAADHKTARDRLEAHSTQASCRKCHRLTDPIGLGLEVFDGIGRYRSTENAVAIDTSGDIDGTAFAGPEELGQAFADNPLTSACLVQTLYRYAVGRVQLNRERPLLRHLEDQFAEQGYRITALMRDIALSEAFRTASVPAASEAAGGGANDTTDRVSATAETNTGNART